ncbi:PREDICTED: solute carrier family 35 member G1-like [Priapulus caudatus]|uniref:Solute carrier family 35 member G1-like n=1 Tax=Priapulus caudatus TaxID=37621 RepID=A0ABM1E2T9_PRICU|nr:PREDICTED: solute carrier family 35 member G1-like [Priapulus caudatus]XP_014666507.1 PREDICTED: solute carrier family 35 member G1-like [Priapulus caudatus]XP_014666508.1 PREDICTED: solute carrier family 35 member G1-like [Priapulus caudatus]XP_014666509.1 PREDICTED: solute carrier family 35 member G1-like [Priapulus caudatus]XP_014666510.1 PREDICTED: solute carrier family 35 member G1-like [Priapulus caudatus]
MPGEGNMENGPRSIGEGDKCDNSAKASSSTTQPSSTASADDVKTKPNDLCEGRRQTNGSKETKSQTAPLRRRSATNSESPEAAQHPNKSHVDAPTVISNETPKICDSTDARETQKQQTETLSPQQHCCVPCLGIFLAILSTITITVSALFKKLSPDVSPYVFLFYTYIGELLGILPVMIYYKVSFLADNNMQRGLLCLRAFLGTVVINLIYVALNYIPLGDLSVIRFSAPVFVGVLACIFLKERCGIFETFWVLLSIAGVILVVKPNFLFGVHGGNYDTNHEIIGYSLVMVAMLCSCMNYILIKKLKHLNVHSSVLVFFVSIFGIIETTVIIAILGEVPYVPCTTSAYYLFLNGYIFCATQMLVTAAIYMENAGIVAIVRTNGIVVAFVFDVVIMKESVSLLSVAGAGLVGLCVIGVSFRKWMVQSKKMQERFPSLAKICGI